MSKKIFMIAMICLLGTAFLLVAAVNVTGDWQLVMKTKKVEKKAVFAFVQDGEKLTVTMKPEKGKELKGDGTVKGNNLEWTMIRKNKNGTALFKYTGVIDGDTMKGEMVVERNNEKKSPLQWSAARKK
jgi:Zn-dependent metalloprotease